MSSSGARSGAAPLRRAFSDLRGLFLGAAAFSLLVNLLMLTGPLFMLQVYDRVLTSRSEATLAALFILIAGLFLAMGLLEHARARTLARAGAQFQSALDGRVFASTLDGALDPFMAAALSQKVTGEKVEVEDID